jgi:hypothetical protein
MVYRLFVAGYERLLYSATEKLQFGLLFRVGFKACKSGL